MSALTPNYGADHPLAEEVKVSVGGIPGFPGKVELTFFESDPINDGVDTFDTAEGQPHTLGRKKASQDWKAKQYVNRPEEVALMEAWYAAAKTGTKGYKLDVTVTYSYADGSVGRVVKLRACFPTNREESGSGQPREAHLTWSFKFWKSDVVKV